MFNHVTLLLDMGGCNKKCPLCHNFISSKSIMLLDDLHLIYELFSSFSKSITISSYYKQIDILPNYKELYSIEKKLSDVVNQKRYHTINYNRYVSDSKYETFINKLNIDEVEFNIYGNKNTHNRYVGVNKNFENFYEKTIKLIEKDIKVNVNYIVNKQNIDELKKTFDLFKKDKICFSIKQNIPTNLGYKKIFTRLTKQDLSKISFLNINIGKTEQEIYSELIKDNSFINIDKINPTFIIDGKKNVYHKLINLESNYYLGNLKIDSIKNIIEKYLSMNTKLLNIINKYSISELCKLIGNPNGNWIFTKEEYIIYLLEQILNEEKYQNIN